MNQKWNPPAPIENLYVQLSTGQEYAARGEENTNDSQLLYIAYELVHNRGQFNDYCKDRRDKPTIQKTWQKFQTFLIIADEDCCK